MFDIKGDKISLNTEDLAIPPFREHFNNAKDKSFALKEIEYVIWLHKWNTPYEAYPLETRASTVAKDVFGDEKYIPTEEVKELEKRFLEFQETPGTRLLSASQTAAGCQCRFLPPLLSRTDRAIPAESRSRSARGSCP